MLENIRRAIFQVPEALAQVSHQELLDQSLGVLVEILGEVDLSCQDLLVNPHGVFITEGRLPADHLIDQNAQSPPVNRFAVAFVQQDLGCYVLWGATKGVGSGAGLDDLREAEIRQLGVASVVGCSSGKTSEQYVII